MRPTMTPTPMTRPVVGRLLRRTAGAGGAGAGVGSECMMRLMVVMGLLYQERMVGGDSMTQPPVVSPEATIKPWAHTSATRKVWTQGLLIIWLLATGMD